MDEERTIEKSSQKPKVKLLELTSKGNLLRKIDIELSESGDDQQIIQNFAG